MTYRQDLALGGSDIRAMVKDFEAWLFYRKLRESGETPAWLEDSTSPAAAFGTLVHMAILEPWQYDAQAIVMPYTESFATKEGRAVKAAALSRAKEVDGFPVRQEHHYAISLMRQSFERARIAFGAPVIDPSNVEIEIFGNCSETQTPIKGKLDWKYGDTLLDLKTVSDWSKLEDVVISQGYHCQLAHYDALSPSDNLVIVWVESVPPYRCQFTRVTQISKTIGAKARSLALHKFAGVKEGATNDNPF